MATYEKSKNGYILRLTITETATNVETNKSTITYKLQLISGNVNHFEMFGVGATVSIDGTTVASRSRANDPQLSIGFNATLTLLSGSTQVTHDADGTKTITVGYTLDMASTSYTPGALSGTGTFVCATIPRATTPTLDYTSRTLGYTVRISVTGRASTSFSHVLTYTLGASSGTLATIAANAANQYYDWTLPATLANQLPNATSGTVSITCTTKSGDTTIGSKNVSLTVLIPNTSTYQPTISSFAVTENNATVSALNLGASYLVQGKSNITISGTPSAQYNATIKTTTYKVGGSAVSSPSNINITASGSLSIEMTATDSRGLSTTSSTTKTSLAYANPSVTAMTFYRANSGGTQDGSGEYLHYSFTGAITSLNSKNANTWAIHVQQIGTSSWTSVASGTGYTLNVSGTSSSAIVSSDYSYNVRLTLTDSFGSSEFYSTISTGYTTMDFKASGHGVAFGKAAEVEDAIEIASDWSFYRGNHEVDMVIDWGYDSTSKFHWRKWKSGFAELWISEIYVTPTESNQQATGCYYSELFYVYPPFMVDGWTMTAVSNNYTYVCNTGWSSSGGFYSYRLGRGSPIATSTEHRVRIRLCGTIIE